MFEGDVMRTCVGVLAVLAVSVSSQQPSPTPAKHGPDQTVCVSPPNNPGITLPNLPESFSVRVEANLLYKKRTTTLHEYYNYDNNMAAVKQVANGAENYFFYMYNSNQFLTVIPDNLGGEFCFKQDLSKNTNQDMFGLKKTNSTSDRIYSVLGALHFGDGINEQYLGQETVRGIPCNKWRSCQYWAEMDATSTVDWYFSDENNWSSISGYTAPVRCHVTGVRWNATNSSYPYEHIYEFYDFQSDLSIHDTHFEVPRNTYCFSETNTKPLPKMPLAYTFDAEILDMNAKTIGFVREEYDNKTNLMRYDYRDPPKASSPFGTRYVSQIHDFNTGVAYIIDVLRANCTTTLIGEHEFDDVTIDPSHVRLRNPNEFLDLNHNYIYQGVRTVRGIDCDTWAAQRFDYPVPTVNNPATTWTWYFATSGWLQMMGFRNNPVLPVMLEIFSDNTQSPIRKQMSFYEYNAEEPDLLTYDLSSCYPPSKSRNFAFLVPGRFRDVVGGDVKMFKYYIIVSLQAVLSISPLRVAHLDVQEAGENVLVAFDLLDKAPLPGDVLNVPNEPSLSQAYQVLTTSVSQGTMQILKSSAAGSLTKITVKPAGPQYQLSSRSRRSAVSAPSPSSSSSNYSGGAMGGMAVGMLVLGALLGFGIMYVIYRVRGGSFAGDISMQRFGNEKEGTNTDTA